MRAVVYDAAREFAVREVPTPVAAPGEIRIKVLQSGICGTDRHLHEGGFGAAFPLTPGHETVGIVDELGAGVDHVVVGEQVTANPNMYCGHCDYCRSGRLILCSNLLAYGVQVAGFFAEYAVVRARQVFSTDGIDPDTAVFAEPASCAMHGLETLQLRPGASVLIFGAGPMGLLLGQMLRSGGASTVTVADPTPAKLTTASALGIDKTVSIEFVSPTNADDIVAHCRGASPDGDGYDVVVEATGSAAVGNLCPPLARNGGTVLIYGVTKDTDLITFRPYDIFRREITIRGSFAEITSFGAAIAMLRSGRVRTDGIITHRYALDEYGKALDAVAHLSTHKAVITP